MHNHKAEEVAIDVALREDVAEIRRRHPFNGNYRAQLAALIEVLFLKYGERIGANRLVGLLAENGSSPSTGTAQDEINKFWEKLRKNNAIKLVREDMPEQVLDMFGEVASRLWHSCSEAAAVSFNEMKEGIAKEIEEARKSQEEAELLAKVEQSAKLAALARADELETIRETLTSEAAILRHQLDASKTEALQIAEELSSEKARQRDEALRMSEAVRELGSSLDRATLEQRRLLAISDDFKQQALRDRAQRQKLEEFAATLEGQIAELRKELTETAKKSAVFEEKLHTANRDLLRLASENPTDAPRLSLRQKISSRAKRRPR